MVVYTIMIIELSQKLIQNTAYRLVWSTNLMFNFSFFGSQHGCPSSGKLSGPDFPWFGFFSSDFHWFSKIRTVTANSEPKSGHGPDQGNSDHGSDQKNPDQKILTSGRTTMVLRLFARNYLFSLVAP